MAAVTSDAAGPAAGDIGQPHNVRGVGAHLDLMLSVAITLRMAQD
ncbi:hypothetical protein [Bradyrhizobium jicamae]|nr:hypothetical protein [Bradyrhizobium jicamae]